MKANPTSKKRKYGTWIGVLIGTLLLFVLVCWGNKQIVVSTYFYGTKEADEADNRVRIVQVSDLHNARFGRNNARLIQKISDLNPDLIVITGDFVDSKDTRVDVAIEFASEAVRLCPVYYVTGNHEHWLDAETYATLMEELKALGVVVLENEKVLIRKEETFFYLIGLDDKHLSDATLKDLLEGTEHEMTVVLAHEPQYFSKYAGTGADLVLAGHAHGGQFRFPFLGGVVAPDQGLFPKYTAGEFFENNTTMIVSRGLGNSVIPFRILNFPELVCVEFVCHAEG